MKPAAHRRPRRGRAGARALTLVAATLLGSLAVAVPAVGDGEKVVAYEQVGKSQRECEIPDVLEVPVRGGCVLDASTGPNGVRYTVVTPFGSMPFATCGTSFKVHLGPTGDAEGTVGAVFGRILGDGGEPCGDLQACVVEGTGVQQPWNGDLHFDGPDKAHMHLNVCMDTCMGWFEGETRFDLVRVDGAWRIRADKALVGDSGLEIDAEWKTTNRDLGVKKRPKPRY